MIQTQDETAAFTSVLIANRGEIAVRVIRAARDAGLRSIAIYTDSDADSLHVRLADEAFGLGIGSTADAYLDTSRIFEVLERSGAEAVHPGYGFLSESAAFARQVIAAGKTWIGPDPETIELLGDKARARALAATVGAPLAPGTDGPVHSPEEVEAFIEAHGLPVVVKAVHGGGGRGIRVVRRLDESAEAFEFVSREANAVFGRGECLVERFLERPRHIEAQIVCDRRGRIAVLGTRDCSLQRRHQKLVEEAPAPWLADEVLDDIRAASIGICRAAGYVGAGTVEFLLGADGTLSFLEVNTRIQVEHPVTEMTTGVDIVREQFRIASGEPIDLPEVVESNGHAIEFRLNAEDPALGFLPAPGRIELFTAPSGPGVRLDSGVEAGSAVPDSFDSLRAKLIVWGRSRDEAFERARRALAELEIGGIATTLPFHRYIVGVPEFAGGEDDFAVHTRWIEEECRAGLDPSTSVLAPADPEMIRFPLEIDGRIHTIGVTEAIVSRIRASGPISLVKSDGSAEQRREFETGNPQGKVYAPFTGILSAWSRQHGESVDEGETVATIEVMKMEIPIVAPQQGTLHHGAQAGANVISGTEIGSIVV